MNRIKRSLVHFLRREDGVTAVECALMLALIVVICIVAINTPQPTAMSDEAVVIQAENQ